mgnify:CR=1 FL=1
MIEDLIQKSFLLLQNYGVSTSWFGTDAGEELLESARIVASDQKDSFQTPYEVAVYLLEGMTSVLKEQALEEGAALAPVRVTQRLGNKKPNLQDFMQVHRKNAGGQVTPRTIEYIKKLINAVEAKSSVSHVDGKCSSLLFQYVTGVVFEGDTNELEGNYRWYDAVEQWNIPSGGYFTVDSF